MSQTLQDDMGACGRERVVVFGVGEVSPNWGNRNRHWEGGGEGAFSIQRGGHSGWGSGLGKSRGGGRG